MRNPDPPKLNAVQWGFGPVRNLELEGTRTSPDAECSNLNEPKAED